MPAPQRKRPGAASSLSLVPTVEHPRLSPAGSSTTSSDPADEPVTQRNADIEPTPAAPDEDRPVPVSVPAPSVDSINSAVTTSAANVPTAEPGIAPALPTPESPSLFIPESSKTPVTMDLPTRLKLRADTAVMRTMALEGGHRSRAQLINFALETELVRLEALFNNGEEFPPHLGAFRNGRPLGS